MLIMIKNLDRIATSFADKYKLNRGVEYIMLHQDEFVIEFGSVFNDLVGEIDLASVEDVITANKSMAYIFARLDLLVTGRSFINRALFLRYYKYYYSETIVFVKMNKAAN